MGDKQAMIVPGVMTRADVPRTLQKQITAGYYRQRPGADQFSPNPQRQPEGNFLRVFPLLARGMYNLTTIDRDPYEALVCGRGMLHTAPFARHTQIKKSGYCFTVAHRGLLLEENNILALILSNEEGDPSSVQLSVLLPIGENHQVRDGYEATIQDGLVLSRIYPTGQVYTEILVPKELDATSEKSFFVKMLEMEGLPTIVAQLQYTTLQTPLDEAIGLSSANGLAECLRQLGKHFTSLTKRD